MQAVQLQTVLHHKAHGHAACANACADSAYRLFPACALLPDNSQPPRLPPQHDQTSPRCSGMRSSLPACPLRAILEQAFFSPKGTGAVGTGSLIGAPRALRVWSRARCARCTLCSAAAHHTTGLCCPRAGARRRRLAAARGRAAPTRLRARLAPLAALDEVERADPRGVQLLDGRPLERVAREAPARTRCRFSRGSAGWLRRRAIAAAQRAMCVGAMHSQRCITGVHKRRCRLPVRSGRHKPNESR
jgi:hypothetical protein